MRKKPQSPLATVRTVYPELTPLFRIRQEEEGYGSLGDYFHWTGYYDLMLRRPHRISAYVAHLAPARQEEAVRMVIENFDSPKKPGSFFEWRLQNAAQEEHWRLHAENRELRDRVRDLEQELAREKAQGRL